MCNNLLRNGYIGVKTHLLDRFNHFLVTSKLGHNIFTQNCGRLDFMGLEKN